MLQYQAIEPLALSSTKKIKLIEFSPPSEWIPIKDMMTMIMVTPINLMASQHKNYQQLRKSLKNQTMPISHTTLRPTLHHLLGPEAGH